MFLLLVFITECYSFITYDAGYASSFAWINGYRECWKNDNDTKEFTFSEQFERVPQILLIMSRYNLDQPSSNGYDFLITQISQTKFSASIYCKYNIKTYETPFYWFAYDDNRVQVISEYNYDIPAYTGTLNKLKTYLHNNPNFKKAIIQLTSFHSTGVWDFVLSVVGLTKTNVTISIKSNNSNFIRVGYYSLIFQFKYSIIKGDDSRSDELRFTPIYFLKVIPVIYKPMLGKVRISQMDSLTPLVIPFFELDIIELTKIYYSAQIETLYIGSDITNLNLILKYNCPSQQQLSLNLLTQISQITNRKIACQKRDNCSNVFYISTLNYCNLGASTNNHVKQYHTLLKSIKRGSRKYLIIEIDFFYLNHPYKKFIQTKHLLQIIYNSIVLSIDAAYVLSFYSYI